MWGVGYKAWGIRGLFYYCFLLGCDMELRKGKLWPYVEHVIGTHYKRIQLAVTFLDSFESEIEIEGCGLWTYALLTLV